MQEQIQKALVILRRKDVERRTGLGRSSLYGLMKSGQFPKSVKISARAVGWLESDIDSFIASKIAASFN
jgi:prophage regulatory protein